MTAQTDSPHGGTDRTRDRIAGALVDNRRIALVVVLAVVLGVSAGVVHLEESAGLSAFDLGTEEEAAMDRIETNFSAEDREVAQVVVRDDNVFEKGTLIATLELQRDLRSNGTVAPTLSGDGTAGIANVVATAAIRHERPDLTDPDRKSVV